jgi:ribosomal protein S18 acetylase RimI-like enzyme
LALLAADSAHPWAGDDLPGDVRLRPALYEEEGAVGALRRACGWSAETVAQQFRAMRDGRREIWIAESDGYLVGTCTVEWVADDAQLADGRTRAHISNLVVHPTYRRRGVGKGLMVAVESASRRRGCRVITIGVDRGNDYARGLYETRGYVVVKNIIAPWGKVHILQRAL